MNARKAAGRDADQIISQAVSQVLEKVRDLRKGILETSVPNENVWFRNLLLGIVNCALHDYKSVEIGAKKSVYLAAWGTRNLLELKVITSYVLASEKNANDFKLDGLIDMKEFYEAVTRGHKAAHERLLSAMSETAEREKGSMREVFENHGQREAKRGPQTQASEAEVAACKQVMLELGLDPDAKPKRASVIARRIQEEAEFDPMFKICSKIMHRTSFSIASSTTRGSLDAVIPLFSNKSAGDLASIYNLINSHIREKGLRPPAH